MTDRELNILVAQKVAGLKQSTECTVCKGTGRMMGYGGYCTCEWCKKGKVDPYWVDLPDYLNDANAVIALLDKRDWKCERFISENVDYHVIKFFTMRLPYPHEFRGPEAKTFCRAACLALLELEKL